MFFKLNMEEIIPNLWISNLQLANDLITVANKNIDAIVNCSKDYSVCNVKDTYRLPINDLNSNCSEKYEIFYNHIHQCISYIYNKLINGSKVLVCCRSGKQISPAIIVAYIMKYGNVKLDVATKFVESKNKNVFRPEMFYKNSLEMYQKYLIQ